MNWLSYHVYPLETADVFLARALRPFLEKHVWPEKSARAFFVRYADDRGAHIRLRFRGEAEWLENTLQPVLFQYFENRGELVAATYEPEPERFGGPDALAWAEEYFHQSTRVVLERLNREQYTYGDAMFDALRLHVITAFAAGFDTKKTGWYFGQLCDQWLPLFFKPEEVADGADWQGEVKVGFERQFAPQRFPIVDALDRFWKDLKKGKIDKENPEWLRWLRANELILKGLGDDLEKALPSLLHLTNNRIGIQNADEVYLNYILGKAF